MACMKQSVDMIQTYLDRKPSLINLSAIVALITNIYIRNVGGAVTHPNDRQQFLPSETVLISHHTNWIVCFSCSAIVFFSERTL